MIRNVLELFFAVSASFITISRVQNYYNHPVDVLYGAVIGTGFAILHIRNAVDVKKHSRIQRTISMGTTSLTAETPVQSSTPLAVTIEMENIEKNGLNI